VPASDAISPEVRTFGATFIVLWTLLLAFVFFTSRKQRVLRAEVERLELALGPETDHEE
jgi:CcmD family protein